jgi:hypothetical protein
MNGEALGHCPGRGGHQSTPGRPGMRPSLRAAASYGGWDRRAGSTLRGYVRLSPARRSCVSQRPRSASSSVQVFQGEPIPADRAASSIRCRTKLGRGPRRSMSSAAARRILGRARGRRGPRGPPASRAPPGATPRASLFGRAPAGSCRRPRSSRCGSEGSRPRAVPDPR